MQIRSEPDLRTSLENKYFYLVDNLTFCSTMVKLTINPAWIYFYFLLSPL